MSESRDHAEVVVIIEDDPDVRALLDEVFSAAGFVTVQASSGLEGVAAVEAHRPAITTLDVNLPGIDGLEAARRIRKISDTHIIMLSALGEESDVVLGLGAGADDYLVKPFRPRELRARIEAFMRRPRAPQSPPTQITALSPTPGSSVATHPAWMATRARNPGVHVGGAALDADEGGVWRRHRDIAVNVATRTVLVAQKEVELTPTEFALLATLFESKRRVRSKSDLALVVRGEDHDTSFYVGEPDKRAIEVHMANLRRKIGDTPTEPSYIETVRGVGYRLTQAVDVDTGPAAEAFA